MNGLNPTDMGVYAVRDSLADEFGPPFLAKNSATATRSYLRMVQTEKITAPQDYSLYCIGIYNPHKGLILSNTKPVLIREGLSDPLNVPKDIDPDSFHKENNA